MPESPAQNAPAKVCESCDRVASRVVHTADAVICGDCWDAHERALDAAVDVAWRDMPSSFQDYCDGDKGRLRRTIEAAVKAYIEWPGEGGG